MLCYSIAHKKQGDRTYSYDDILNDNQKKSYAIYGKTIEELDKLTAISSSPTDLCELEREIIIASAREEDIEKKVPIFSEPFILVEASAGEKLSTNFITDIVYSKDKDMLDNRYGIQVWAEEYLTQHPKAIYEFNDLRVIYFIHYSGQEITSDLAREIIRVCLKTDDYIKYRKIYFKLKSLDPETAKRIWNL